MPMMPHPQIRTTSRNRTRLRRFSACHRHPSEPVTGLCALCLRDRLASLDSSSDQDEVEKKVFVCSRRTRGHGGASSFAAAPELQRSKSVAADKCEVLNGVTMEARRKSCDIRARSSFSDMFVIDDTKRGGGGVVRADSMNLGFPSISELVAEMKEDEEEENEDEDDVNKIRVSEDVFVRNEAVVEEEGDLKTMKEIIDMELQNKKRNFWEAASVFSQKLRKWRQKQKDKKQSRRFNGGTHIDRSNLGRLSQYRDTQSEVADYGLGRRSCDTEPRFSIDAHRLSVEDQRFSFDEHRASWDGYMIARTIPHLTPMLSIVDNMMLPPVNRGANTAMENLQMHSIREDGASSGGLNQSSFDSSTSNRGSSSSSMKSSSTKTTVLSGDEVKFASKSRVSPANDVIFQGTKLVITEKELKDWHLNSIKNNTIESVPSAPNLGCKATLMNPSNGHKNVMSSRWKKVCNLWGHKHKFGDKNDDKNADKKNIEDMLENRVEIRNSSTKHVRNMSFVNSRNRVEQNGRDFVFDRNRSTRYSTSDLDSGLLRLYLTPFRNSRKSKYGKSRASSMATNGLQLN